MRSIAQDLNVSHSTISREIKRNSGKRGYRFNQADAFARQKHQTKGKFIKLGADAKQIVNNCLALDWSPKQVCGWLNANHGT